MIVCACLFCLLPLTSDSGFSYLTGKSYIPEAAFIPAEQPRQSLPTAQRHFEIVRAMRLPAQRTAPNITLHIPVNTLQRCKEKFSQANLNFPPPTPETHSIFPWSHWGQKHWRGVSWELSEVCQHAQQRYGQLAPSSRLTGKGLRQSISPSFTPLLSFSQASVI